MSLFPGILKYEYEMCVPFLQKGSYIVRLSPTVAYEQGSLLRVGVKKEIFITLEKNKSFMKEVKNDGLLITEGVKSLKTIF